MMDNLVLEEEMDEQAPTGMERTALVQKESLDSGEVYSSKKCLKARSFRLGLCVSFMVLLALLITATIVITTLAVQYHSRRRVVVNNVLTLDDVFRPELKTKSFTGSWINNQLVTMTTERGVVLLDPSSNNERTLITAEKLSSLNDDLGTVSEITLSPSFLSGGEERMLLRTNSKHVYRHSTLDDYYIYSVDTGEAINLTKPTGNHSDDQFQYAVWSPNSQFIAYVLDFNLYVLNVSGSGSVPIPITTDGSRDGTVYGIPDWVYEEEVFSVNHALWWSPDSTKLLFGAFDDSGVGLYSFPEYGDRENQYDTIVKIRYPKPGTTNPTVAMFVVNISDPSTQQVLPAGSLVEFDHYVAYAGWVDADRPYVSWLNRTQTYIEFCTYSNDFDVCNPFYSYEIPGMWVEQYSAENVLFFSDTDGHDVLLTLLSQYANSGGDTSTQLAMVKDTVTFLTGPGEWVVTEIVGHYQDNVLYISTETSPLARHLYSYSKTSGTSTCLSCDQESWGLPSSPNPSIPDTCDYFRASCDSQLDYCLLHCRGPCIPYTVSAHFDKSAQKLDEVRVREGNAELRVAVEGINLPTTESFTIPWDDDAPPLNGMMTLPPGFDSSQQYPVLVYVYGGPNSQTVSYNCMLLSLSHLFYVSNLSLILVSVDGRGTGFRNDNFKFSVFGKLGILETEDQLRAGRYLQSLSYVNRNHLAIYGSSYGGYMAAMVGSSGSGVYSTAISQSPVTDWHYYDSIYTERYMNKPNDNDGGYKNGSVLPRVKELADVHYLLIHGTADDNVHYQNTAQLSEALEEADIQFRMQVYTDRNHNIAGSGENIARHLYQLIANFLRESFK